MRSRPNTIVDARIEAIVTNPSEARVREVLEAFACDLVKAMEDSGTLEVIEDCYDARLSNEGIRASIAANAFGQLDGTYGRPGYIDVEDAFIARHSYQFEEAS